MELAACWRSRCCCCRRRGSGSSRGSCHGGQAPGEQAPGYRTYHTHGRFRLDGQQFMVGPGRGTPMALVSLVACRSIGSSPLPLCFTEHHHARCSALQTILFFGGPSFYPAEGTNGKGPTSPCSWASCSRLAFQARNCSLENLMTKLTSCVCNDLPLAMKLGRCKARSQSDRDYVR